MTKFFVLILFSGYSLLFSQSDSIYNFTLPSVKINQSEKGKTISYEFDNNYNSFSVTDSFLIASPNKYNYKVRISDLEKVSFTRSSSVLPVIVTGFGIGFVFGYMGSGGSHGSASDGERFLGGLIVGGVLGLVAGAVSVLISHDKDYDLPKYDLSAKKKYLIKVLKENKL